MYQTISNQNWKIDTPEAKLGQLGGDSSAVAEQSQRQFLVEYQVEARVEGGRLRLLRLLLRRLLGLPLLRRLRSHRRLFIAAVFVIVFVIVVVIVVAERHTFPEVQNGLVTEKKLVLLYIKVSTVQSSGNKSDQADD